ncbi:MAG: NAD(P)H-dependent glycerol-3-phosphate dehydrogenase [Acidobacteriota bacterium]
MSQERPPLGVVGAGSWGTALAINQALAGREVVLWARREELVEELRSDRRSPYLPGVGIPTGLLATSDLGALVRCDPILIVVPSHGLRDVVRQLLPLLPTDHPARLVSSVKGIEPVTLARMSEVCAEEAARVGRRIRFAMLAGPTFAAEVAVEMPTTAVIAAGDEALARELQDELSTRSLRLYTSTDLVGVELGGATKNVIAIAAGVVSGLGLGHNTLAALITRGLHEVSRLGVAYGGDLRTFSGLAGLGDLVLTCTGGLSRNRRTGLELAAGKTLAEISASTMQVAEGVRNSIAVAKLAERKGVEMPISEQMVAVLYEGKSPRQGLEDLMRRELKRENAL